MCWISKTCIKQIATEDILIFKLMEKVTPFNCVSFIQYFNYNYKHLYSLGSEIVVETGDSIYIINEGFHSYDICLLPEFEPIRTSLVVGIIPKDAVYYKNTCGEIVSNQIIITSPYTQIIINKCVY